MLVLDSSALINNEAFVFEKKCFTTPEAFSELRSGRPRLLAEAARGEGLLVVEEPGEESVSRVKKALKELCEDRLSDADIGVLALALEKKAVLVSDDYGVQNAAGFLGLSFRGSAFGEIGSARRWVVYCPGCRKKYSKLGVCPVCGSELKRKPGKL